METQTLSPLINLTLPEFESNKKGRSRNEELTQIEQSAIKQIFNIVENYFNTEKDSIFTRNASVTKAKETFYRHIIWTACVYIFKIKKAFKIAEFSGGYKHSTLNYGVNRIADMLTMPYLEKQVQPVLENVIEIYNFNLKRHLEVNGKPLRQITYEIWKEQFLAEINKFKNPKKNPYYWKKKNNDNN